MHALSFAIEYCRFLSNNEWPTVIGTVYCSFASYLDMIFDVNTRCGTYRYEMCMENNSSYPRASVLYCSEYLF